MSGEANVGKVALERRGHVLLIELDRAAKRNAFDLPLWNAVCAAYGELERDDDLRVGVLHAAGEHFTGGLDLPQWAPVFQSGAFAIPAGGLDPLGLNGPRLRKPIVAAVQGLCFTIGIELLLATDVRVAAEGVRFAQIEIKRGIYRSVARPCASRARSAGATPCAGCSPATSSAPPRRCASAWCRRSRPRRRPRSTAPSPSPR